MSATRMICLIAMALVFLPVPTLARAEDASDVSVALEKTCLGLGKGRAAQVSRYADQSPKSVQCLLSGELDGPEVEFYPNGALASSGSAISEKQSGMWTYYYPDGKKKEEGYYWFGVRVCTWKAWDPSGVLKSKEEWKPKGRTCQEPWPSDLRSVPTAERGVEGVPGEATAPVPLGSPVLQRFQFRRFQATVQAWTQYSKGAALTGGVGWAPSLRLIDRQLELVGQIGLGLNRAFAGGFFFLTDYQVLASYIRWMPYFFRLGTGAQTWYGGGTGWMASGQIGRALPLWFVDSVFVSYSVITFPAGDLTHEIYAGIGLSFEPAVLFREKKLSY